LLKITEEETNLIVLNIMPIFQVKDKQYFAIFVTDFTNSPKTMRKLLLILFLFTLTILGLITLFNTFSSFSKQLKTKAIKPIEQNDSLISQHLVNALRIQVVSAPVDSIFTDANEKLQAYLNVYFPLIQNDPNVKQKSFGEYSRLYRWQGRSQRLKPILLLLRSDVKDPDLKKIPLWTYNPFLGKIADGFIWGAGSMGDKTAAIAALEALESMLAQGELPQRSLYIALIQEQDDNDKNRILLAELLKKEELEFELILGTESYIAEDLCMGIKKPIALIGCAERRELQVQLSGDIGQLRKTVEMLQKKSTGIQWAGKATTQLIETLTPELPFGDKWALCNRWLLGNLLATKLYADPLLGEMLHSESEIVSLGKTADAKMRWLLSPDVNINEFKKSIAPYLEGLKAEWSDENAPKRGISPQKGYAYEALQSSIRQVMGDILVFPSIAGQPTSLRYFEGLSAHLCHFRPWAFDMPELERLRSGIDQRLPLKQYLQGVQFYKQLLKNTLF